MIKVLIVDDEALAIRRLEIKLTRFADVEIIGTARDGDAAVAALSSKSPDLVLLDINMPGMDGLDVADCAATMGIDVIFVTAFNQYAVQAFERHVLDYLLKPVNQDRLETALNRFRLRQKRSTALDKVGELNSVLAQLRAQNLEDEPAKPDVGLWIKDRGRNRKISLESIEWVEASRDYVTVHMVGGRSHFVRDTMRHFESMLDPLLFQRVHRSTIVNILKIKEVNMRKSVQYLMLHGGAEVRVGRAYKVQTSLRLKEIFVNP